MVVELLVVFLMFGLAIGGGLLLYVLVREEGRNRPEMDRERAERVARRDTRDEVDDRR